MTILGLKKIIRDKLTVFKKDFFKIYKKPCKDTINAPSFH